MSEKDRIRIIGIGNPFRGDDRAGLDVVRAIADRLPPGVAAAESAGDVTELLEHFRSADRVILVDAVQAEGRPRGEWFHEDLSAGSLPEHDIRTSTHAIGLMQAVELARVLGAVPSGLEFFGIIGGAFGQGEALSPEVALAVREVSERLMEVAGNA